MHRVERTLQAIGVIILLLFPFVSLPASPAAAADNAPTPTIYTKYLPVVNLRFRNLASILINYPAEPLLQNNTQWNLLSIQADEAWKLGYGGANGPVVAVVDTGVDLKHPDLVDNLLPGYDFVSNDAIPQDESSMGHGTHVAGIIAAEINGKGVLGVAPFAYILPVRVLARDGTGTADKVALGIRWAADNGAKIINLSLGYRLQNNFLDDVLKGAIEYAQSKDCLVVAAVGNQHTNVLSYPAAYPGVLAATAVDRGGYLASFSNYGSYTKMLAAPGVDITSTYPGGRYQSGSGTSQAAAHVSGAAALVWEAHPGYKPAQIEAALLSGALPLGSQDLFGAGLVQLDKAIAAIPAMEMAVSPQDLIPETGIPGENRSAAIESRKVLVRFAKGVNPTEVLSGGFEGVSISSSIESLGLVELRVPAGKEWDVVDALRALPGVSLAQPSYLMQGY